MKEVCCVVSGSFTKFKKEIDLVIECFEDNKIKVLSPDKGGLMRSQNNLWTPGSYPLRTEVYLSEVEAKVRHADFILKDPRVKFGYFYVGDEGYLGEDAAREAGMAHGRNLSLYSSHQLSILEGGNGVGGYSRFFEVKTPEEVAHLWGRS